MRQTRKILVIIFNPQSRDDSIGMPLQLRRKAGIRLRRQNLHGDRHVVDFLLGQERRMCDGDGVDEIFACFDISFYTLKTKYSNVTCIHMEQKII